MKKRWYKRIFAGILALALTATSFSGDIQNLVRAAGFSENYEQMVNGWVKETITSSNNYTTPTKIIFELQNQSAEQTNVNCTLSIKYADTDVTVTSTPSMTIDGNSNLSFTLDDSSLNAISLANGESATVTLQVDNPNIFIRKANSGGYFDITTSVGSDNATYGISIGDTEITLLSGQEYTFTPVIDVLAYQGRSITVPTGSGSNIDVADNGDGSYKVTPKSGANGTDTITMTAPNGASKTLTVNVKKIEIDPSSGVYTGKEQKPNVKLNGSVLDNVPWSPSVPKDAGDYVGTVTVGGTDMHVAYTVSPLNLSSATMDLTNLVINNATSAVTGTIKFTNADSSTFDVEVNNGKGVNVDAVYASTAGDTITYNLTITGSGNFSGTVATTKTSEISGTNQIDITSKLKVTIDDSACEYTGSEVLPALTVTYNGGALTPGTATAKGIPYSTGGKIVAYATFANNINAGDAQVAVTGAEENGFTGGVEGEYFIRSIDISDCTITITPTSKEVGYTGTAVKLESIVVEKGGTTFTEGVDYDVNYTNNVNIGKKACATIVPKDGNLEGSPVANYFTIIGTLDNATVLINNTTSFATDYTGSDIEPAIKMYFGTNTAANRLTAGTDYTIAYANNKDAGEADIVITGKGKYAGQSRTVHFTIKPIPLPNTLKVQLSSSRSYTGNPITLSTTEFGFGSTLNDISTDNYDNVNVVYSNNRDAGTATITVSGKKNYTGTASASFKINPVDIAAAITAGTATMTVDQDPVTYTGTALTPGVTVTLNGVELASSDFNTPKYSNNVKVGTAEVILTGTGKNVSGTIKKTFTIVARNLNNCTFTLGGQTVRQTADPNVFESDYKAEYTGQSINAALSVKDNGKNVAITEYYKDTPTSRSTYVFREGDTPGQATKTTHPEADVVTKQNYFTVKGEGAYVGSNIKIYFTVEPRDIKSDGITFELDDAKLAIGDTANMFKSVKDTHPGKIASTETLTKGVDYKVELPADGNKAGTHVAKITGIGNYSNGSDNKPKEIEYTIGSSLENLRISLYPKDTSSESEKYTENAEHIIQTDYLGTTPAVKVFLPNGTLASTSDYVLTFSDTSNFNADGVIRTVKVEAKPGSLSFYGEATVQYVINKVNLATLQTQGVLELVSDKGDKSDSTNTVTVEYNEDAHLIKDFHLYRLDAKGSSTRIGELGTTDVQYDQNQLGPAVQTITLNATGINTNYEGKATFTLKLKEKEINTTNFTITLPPADSSVYTYTGSAIEPTITVKDKATGKVLEKDKDYTVAYTNNVDPGSSATYTVTGKGNYTGSVNGGFSVNQISVKDFVVDFESGGRYPYTGSAIEPSYTVSYNGVILKKDVDYTADFNKNTNPTTKAELRISAKDTKYTGNLEPFYFTIVGKMDLAESAISVNKNPLDDITIHPTDTTDTILERLGLKNDFVKFTPTNGEAAFYLKYGEDYTVSNVDVSIGEKQIILQSVPNGRFTGSITLSKSKFKGLFSETLVVDRTPNREEYYTGATIDHKDKIKLTWNGELVNTDKYIFTGETSGTNRGQYDYTVKPSSTSDDTWADMGSSKAGDWYIVYNLNDMTLELVSPVKKDTDASGREYYYLTYDGTDKSAAVKGAIKLKMTSTGNPVSGITEGTNYKVVFDKTPKNPDDYTFTLSKADGSSAYTTGSVSGAFTIQGIKLGRCEITGFTLPDGSTKSGTSLEYTGEAAKPIVKVYDSNGNEVTDSYYNLFYYDKDGNQIASATNANDETDVDDYYYVTAQGKAGYTGTTTVDVSCKFKITPYAIDAAGRFTSGLSPKAGDISAVADETVVYTGSPVEPAVSVNYHTSSTGTKALVEGKDYEITYADNTKVSSKTDIPRTAGYAYFTITGKGNYKGTVTKNFVINQAEIKNITLTKNTSPYTGSAIDITHFLKVADETGENELVYGTDYTVTPTTKTDKGTYDIKIIGKGNYTGETRFDKDGNPLTFTITARNFADTYIDVKIDSKTNADSKEGYIISDYICQTFPATEPALTVKDTGIGAGTTLTEGTDYEIVGWFNTDKSGDGSLHDETKSPYVEIKAKDGSQYEGSKKIYFSIGKDLRKGYISYTRVDYTYNGKDQYPSVSAIKVYDGVSATPVSATNGGYDINYPEDRKNAGKKQISVTGKKNYFGTLNTYSDHTTIVEYAINPRNLQTNRSKIQMTLDLPQDASGNYYAYWTGSDIEPAVTVKDTELFNGTGYTLQEGLDKDYTVKYEYNTDITLDGYPKAKVTIVPHNNYTDEGDVGVIYKEFKIIPIEIASGNIDVQWTNFTPGVGNDVVDWVDEATPVVPDYTVLYKADDGSSTTLTAPADYIATYGYRNAAGDYVTSVDPGFKWYAGPMDLIVTGAGNYHGEVKKTYAVRADISGIDENVDILSGKDALFTGNIPVLENLQIKYASENVLHLPTSADEVSSDAHSVVWENDDFRMEYTCPGGDYHYGHLVIKSVGSRYYTGTFEMDFIASGDVTDISVVNFKNEYNYTGAPVNVEYQLKTSGGTIVSNSISSVQYLKSDKSEAVSPIERGSYYARITIELDGNTKVEDHAFEIKAGDLSAAKVVYTDTWTYTKSQIKPPVQVYDTNGHLLTAGTDYDVVYGDNILPTTYPTAEANRTGTITIKGATGSNYEGSEKTVKFAINLASPGVVDPVYGVRLTDVTSDSVKLNWNRNTAVGNWVIEYTENPGAEVVVQKTIIVGSADNFKEITGLKADTPYKFEIYSKMGTVEGEHKSVTGSTTPEKMASIAVATSGANQATITWTAVSGISGYEIVRTDSLLNNYRLVVSLPIRNNPTSWINSRLVSGKTYWYKMRTYKVDDDRVVHYGGWSDPVQITVP